jgi:R3H domain/RNA recognition motif. (a.k.a. RRM, RBD, or RNP domain)
MNATMTSSTMGGLTSFPNWPTVMDPDLNNVSATSRINRDGFGNRPTRGGLPPVSFASPSQLNHFALTSQGWMEPPMQGMPPFGHDPNGPAMDNPSMRLDNMPEDPDELIPTAIVIKNIPFAVKKEQLVQVMTDLGLPLPYAFNYHFDGGVFRGLAFANFTSADETAQVIQMLNHYELNGRKLRVEYKKMLPQAERERIEREKRLKRGQLEEQHRPNAASQLQTQSSISSLASQLHGTSPSPKPWQQYPPMSAQTAFPSMNDMSDLRDCDFNDPIVLTAYTQLLFFKQDFKRDHLSFPPTLTPAQRRSVHSIAHKLQLPHVSKGEGGNRAVHIYRFPEAANISPPPLTDRPVNHAVDTHRRALARAATTDLSEHRDTYQYGTLGRQGSGLLGPFPDSPGLTNSHLLRSSKSYAELRSVSPSPVASTASYPTNPNISRLQELAGTTTGSSNPNLTSTSLTPRDETMLVNGMSSMGLGSGFGAGSSPRSTRNIWEQRDPGAIGSNRAFGTAMLNLEEQNRSQNQSAPQRQPRGPAPERGPGFTQRRSANGHSSARGSDELSPQTEVDPRAQ